MVPLARALLRDGHAVLWATPADATPLVTAAGIDAVPAGAHGAAAAALRAAVFAGAAEIPGAGRAAFVFPHLFGAAMAPPMAADLIGLATDWRPDLLVHGHAELAAPLVGELCGVPTVTHSFGTVVPKEYLDAAAKLSGLWGAHGLETPPYAGCGRAGYLDICPPSVQTGSLDHLPEVQALRPVDYTGPVATPPEPLVYVTLGTVHGNAELLQEIVAGVAALQVPVVVATGPRIEPAALGEQPDHVRVESWVDQPAVLGRCSAVVSHGGSGTFLGALACGLPQLCLPQAADQFRNAEGGVRVGAALTLAPDEVSAASVRVRVERLLADPQLRTAAQRVAAEIAAMPAPEVVAHRLAERFGDGPDGPPGQLARQTWPAAVRP